MWTLRQPRSHAGVSPWCGSLFNPRQPWCVFPRRAWYRSPGGRTTDAGCWSFGNSVLKNKYIVFSVEKPSIANRHFGFLRGRSYKVPPRFRHPQTFCFLLQGISWGQFVENTFWKIQLHTNFSSNAKKERERESERCKGRAFVSCFIIQIGWWIQSKSITRWSKWKCRASVKSASNSISPQLTMFLLPSYVVYYGFNVNYNLQGAMGAGAVLNCNFMGQLIKGSHRPDEMFGFDLNPLHRGSFWVSELITSKSRKQHL